MIEQPAGQTRQRNQWWVNVMLVLAGILIPVAIMLTWLSFLVLDEDRYVRTVTPVIDVPEIQAIVSDALALGVRTSIEGASSASARMARLVTESGGIEPILTEIRALIERAIATPQFSAVWSEVNRLAHSGLIAILSKEATDSTNTNDEITLAFANLASDLGVEPDSRAGRVLAEIPDQLAPRIAVLQSVEIPAARFVIDNARLIDLTVILVIALLLGFGLWFSRNRSRALIVLGLVSLVSLPIALVVRNVLRSALSDLSGPEGVLAREYASVLTASLESGLIMAAALGLIVAVIAWFWPRFSRPIATA